MIAHYHTVRRPGSIVVVDAVDVCAAELEVSGPVGGDAPAGGPQEFDWDPMWILTPVVLVRHSVTFWNPCGPLVLQPLNRTDVVPEVLSVHVRDCGELEGAQPLM